MTTTQAPDRTAARTAPAALPPAGRALLFVAVALSLLVAAAGAFGTLFTITGPGDPSTASERSRATVAFAGYGSLVVLPWLAVWARRHGSGARAAVTVLALLAGLLVALAVAAL